jgi:hypothetical protein
LNPSFTHLFTKAETESLRFSLHRATSRAARFKTFDFAPFRAPPRHASHRQFAAARGKLSETLNGALGRNARTPQELKLSGALAGGNASAGSVGEAYAERFTTGLKATRKPVFDRSLFAARSGAADRKTLQPETLIAESRLTVDIKTGYADGNIDLNQLRDYNSLVKRSQLSSSVELRARLKELGVPGGKLDAHAYVFLPTASVKAEDAARKAYGKMEDALGKDMKNIRVYFLGDDGNLYQLSKSGDAFTTSSTGQKLPNR